MLPFAACPSTTYRFVVPAMKNIWNGEKFHWFSTLHTFTGALSPCNCVRQKNTLTEGMRLPYAQQSDPVAVRWITFDQAATYIRPHSCHVKPQVQGNITRVMVHASCGQSIVYIAMNRKFHIFWDVAEVSMCQHAVKINHHQYRCHSWKTW